MRLTGVAACAATFVDAWLLERKKAFFSGGFLAVDHLTSAAETGLFLAASLATDAAVLGMLVAFALFAVRPIHLTTLARRVAVVAAALLPMGVANFVAYQLHTYLGDAFDVALMFDLAGRRPEEFFAVASAHLASPAALVAAGGVVGAAVVWALNCCAPGEAHQFRPPHHGRRWVWTAGLFALGLCTTAAFRASSDVMDNGLRRKPSGRVLGLVAERASDMDGDGFGTFGRIADPAPLDAAVYPYALDLPGNGVDEDGVGGDLPESVDAYTEPADSASEWRVRPDIVLFVLESFRADALGASLHRRPARRHQPDR